MTLQLQLVNLNDENNTQVYIQIDNTNNQQLQHLMEQQVTEGVDQEEAETIELESSATGLESTPTGLESTPTGLESTPTGPTQPRIVRATHPDIKEVCVQSTGTCLITSIDICIWRLRRINWGDQFMWYINKYNKINICCS